MSRNKPKDPHDALLGDLESIREVLDDDEEHGAAANEAVRALESAPTGSDRGLETVPKGKDRGRETGEDDALEVPLLEDVVAEAQEDAEPLPSLDDDNLFQALLGEDWKSSAGALLERARGEIEGASAGWTPEHTDALNDALKVRIDETLHAWLANLLAERADDLRQTLLAAISDQLDAIVRDGLAGPGKPDGK